MNVFINEFSNSIVICGVANKKMPTFFKEIVYPYPLTTLENQKKAITSLLESDDKALISKDASNSLIIFDDSVFNGVTELPHFSRSKTNDAFETRFKISFPDFDQYYLTYKESERNANNTLMSYTVCKTERINSLVDVFKQHNINIVEKDYFGNVFANRYENKNHAVRATIIIGQKRSEFIVLKDSKVVFTTIIDAGREDLLEKGALIDSTYNTENEEAYKYASFHKTHFDSKGLLTDEIIDQNTVHESFITAKPKETRLLKGESLTNYNIKQNFIKFVSHVIDILDFYSQKPFFLPIREILVISDDDVFANLLSSNTMKELKFLKCNDQLSDILSTKVSSNELFRKQLKKKIRRKIDWAKFLSMEIGGKKKKA